MYKIIHTWVKPILQILLSKNPCLTCFHRMYMEIQWKCKSLTFCWPKITGTIFMPCIDAKHIRQPTGKTSECKNKTLSTGAHWSLATIVRTPDTVAISLYFGRPAGTMMHVQEQGQGRTAVCLQAITFSLSIYRHPALSYVGPYGYLYRL